MARPINPIIPGFSPDPSAVKVGDWFFLVNSTFHMFPGLPIYASKDLLSWKHICNAIHRPGQLSLAQSDTRLVPLPDLGEVMLTTGGLYAPTIRHRDGTFYVVCTNVIHNIQGAEHRFENFILSTTDIWSGEWSDPVPFDFHGIDPSILFDDDGKVYIQGSRSPGPYTKINQFEIDLKTGQKLSEEKTIWGGSGGIYPEGPHMYKRNGWYYLMISEGGTHEGHMITMARSKDVWGPYDPCPNNPILTACGTDEYIRYTGHCDTFQDDKMQWWGTCLGVRKDSGGRFVMGRESFLTRGTWDGDWLSFETVKLNPEGLVRQPDAEALSAAPNVDYLYIRDPNLRNYRMENGSPGALTASSADLSHPETSPSFVGKRQRLLDGESSVTFPRISKDWATAKLRCGIACYKDEHRYVRIYYEASAGDLITEVINTAKKIHRTEHHTLGSAIDSLSLRITYSEQEYRLLYETKPASDDGWDCLAVIDTLDVTDPDFVGPVMGVFAVCESEGVEVDFSDLQIE